MGTTIHLHSIKSSLPFSLPLRHSCDKLSQAPSCFSVLQVTESWAGPGNEATSKVPDIDCNWHFMVLYIWVRYLSFPCTYVTMAEISIDSSCPWLDHSYSEAFIYIMATKPHQNHNLPFGNFLVNKCKQNDLT